MTYKLISIDMDGTLLNSKDLIPQKNIDAIKNALQKDVHIILNSGRSFQSMKDYMLQLGTNIVSSNNGATVYEYQNDESHILRELFFDINIAKDILNTVGDYPHVLMFIQDNIFVERKTDRVMNICERSNIEPILTSSFETINQNISKILLLGENQQLQDIKDKLSVYKDRSNIFFSHHDMLEITASNIDKSSSLKFITDYLNIPLEQTIAIGDSFNDIEMIKLAGLGIATQNAADEVKEIADHVSRFTNEEFAVAEIINEFILK